jgi:hypothetical protein
MTTIAAGKRLGVVPTQRDLFDRIDQWSMWAGREQLEPKLVTAEIAGLANHIQNLWPNADGLTLAGLVNAIRDLTDSMTEYDREAGTAVVDGEAVKRLITLRLELEKMA